MNRGPAALFGAIVAVGLGPAMWLGVRLGAVDVAPVRPPAVVGETSGPQQLVGGAGAGDSPVGEDSKVKSTSRGKVLRASPSPTPSATTTSPAPTESSASPGGSPTPSDTDEPTTPTTPPTESTTEPTTPPTDETTAPTLPPGPPTGTGPGAGDPTGPADSDLGDSGGIAAGGPIG